MLQGCNLLCDILILCCCFIKCLDALGGNFTGWFVLMQWIISNLSLGHSIMSWPVILLFPFTTFKEFFNFCIIHNKLLQNKVMSQLSIPLWSIWYFYVGAHKKLLFVTGNKKFCQTLQDIILFGKLVLYVFMVCPAYNVA